MPLTFLFNSKTADRGYIYYSLYNGWGKSLTGNTGVRCTRDTYESVKSKSAKLRNLKSTVDSYILNKQTLLQSVTREEMQTFIDGLLGGDTGLIKLTVYEVLNGYYLQVNEDKIKNEGKAFSGSKKRTLRVILQHVNKTYIGKKEIKYLNTDDVIFLQDYLFEEKLSKNTVHTYMKLFRFMVQETFKIHRNPVHAESGLIPKRDKKTLKIALSIDEIQKIHTTAVPDKYVKARDILVYGCNVGLRYSDLNENISPESLQNGLFSIPTRKTDTNVFIPMTALANEIWNKYHGKMPKIAYNTFKGHIKKICQLAGITETILITKTVDGKKIVNYTPKWMLVTTHIMRRSMATNAVLAGIPLLNVKEFLGHSSIKQTEEYVCLTPQQLAESIKGHAFFKSK